MYLLVCLFRLMDFRVLIRMNFLAIVGILRREWFSRSDEFSATAAVQEEAEDHLSGYLQMEFKQQLAIRLEKMTLKISVLLGVSESMIFNFSKY